MHTKQSDPAEAHTQGRWPPGLGLAQVVEHCANLPHGRGVTRIGELAIKFGRITTEEVDNQRTARALLHPGIVLVPDIYCFFTEAETDYLVMEFVEGDMKTLDQVESLIPALSGVILRMHCFTSTRPGPVNGGGCAGTLWSEDEQTILKSREHLDQHINARLLHTRCNFQDAPLVFTHGDLNLRNLLFSGDRICLLDWEFAGYFPRSAEIAILRQDYGENMDDLRFRGQLEAAILAQQPLTTAEEGQVDAWLEFAFNNIRFSWTRKGEMPLNKQKRRRTSKETEVPEVRLDGILDILDDVRSEPIVPASQLAFFNPYRDGDVLHSHATDYVGVE